MRRRRPTNPDLLSNVNVTPIIDVALVLVIILLVTAPMMAVADLPVNLPSARTRGVEDQRNVSITLGANGELAVDEKRVTNDVLRTVLAAKLAMPGNSDVLVVIRADAGASYGQVRGLLADARVAGAHRIAIATRQKAEAPR